jgi:hypothetical protein
MRRALRWLAIGAVALVVAVVGGTYVYIHYIEGDPPAPLTLTSPISLGTLPPNGAIVTYKATGNLELHGTTKPVTLTLKAKRDGGTIAVNGSIPITFADWGIANPSFGPASTDDHGQLEFLLAFAK